MDSAFPATIAAPVEAEVEIRKSRFIAHVTPVASVDEADAVIAATRKAYWDARHNCTAMVTGLRGDQARSSDDGEPSGTAGVPMLEALRRRGLTDLVAVVTRYFGGVKLGAGGLVRAYSTTLTDALDRARLMRRVPLTHVTVEVSHADAGRYDNALREWATRAGALQGESTYGACATHELWVRGAELPSLHEQIAALSGGTLDPIVGGERIIDVPVSEPPRKGGSDIP